MSMNQRAWHDELTDTGSKLLYPLGTQRWDKNALKRYRYVEYDNGDAIAAVVGKCVGYTSASLGAGTWLVTPDISAMDGSSGAKAVGAGVMLSVIADGEYGWIQVEGISDALAQDLTAGAVGDECTAVGASDGEFDVVATGYIGAPCGIILDVTGSANIIFIQCP